MLHFQSKNKLKQAKKSEAKLRGKFWKMSIFQKWSLKSKIRNGYGLRLYVNSLRRLWWPWKPIIGCAPALSRTPIKHCFSKALIALHSPSSQKPHFWLRKSIFEKLFKIILSSQIWLLMTFWMSESHRESISDPLRAFGNIWQKKKFWIFFRIFLLILACFSLFLLWKWSKIER